MPPTPMPSPKEPFGTSTYSSRTLLSIVASRILSLKSCASPNIFSPSSWNFCRTFFKLVSHFSNSLVLFSRRSLSIFKKRDYTILGIKVVCNKAVVSMHYFLQQHFVSLLSSPSILYKAVSPTKGCVLVSSYGFTDYKVNLLRSA